MNPVSILQARIGVNPDGVFGRKTFYAFCEYFKFTPIQSAHILGQCEHETGGFNIWQENLNYSASGLLATFPKHYKDGLVANLHQRKPELIARKVYGGRMGNNLENDGWNFRGRGAVQLTGRWNYESFAKWIKDPSVLTDPSQVATKYAFDSAIFFFTTNKIIELMVDGSDDTILRVSRRVNGGTNGLKDRIAKTKKYIEWTRV